MVQPMQSIPFSFVRRAATLESTPPLMAISAFIPFPVLSKQYITKKQIKQKVQNDKTLMDLLRRSYKTDIFRGKCMLF
jgi:hypothetical protein